MAARLAWDIHCGICIAHIFLLHIYFLLFLEAWILVFSRFSYTTWRMGVEYCFL